jgi:hypothetical protein
MVRRVPTPEWAIVEDVFLTRQCRLEPLPYGARYANPRAPSRRFNAVRIQDAEALAATDWEAEIPAQAAHAAALGLPLTLQLPDPLRPPDVGGPWQEVGTPFVHVRTALADLAGPVDPSLALRLCETDAEIDAFARTVLDARVPAAIREMAIAMTAATIRAHLPLGDRQYLAEVDGEIVGCIGCLPVPGGYTVAGMTVVEARRGRGIMKGIYAAVAATLEGNLYGQIEDGLATLRHRERLPSTAILARTRTWQPAQAGTSRTGSS